MIKIFDMRAFVLWAISSDCSLASSTGRFSPELGMLMAESLVTSSGANPRSYAAIRNMSGGVFQVNGTDDRFVAEPIDFANRLNAMREFCKRIDRDSGIDEAIERFNTTCIDPRNVTAHYKVSSYATVGMAEAGILASIMSMRAKVCGYTSAQLFSFTRSQVRAGKAEVERQIVGMTLQNDGVRCWLQRLDDAIRRLGESTDPLDMGFLTIDTCMSGRVETFLLPRNPVTIAVSEPLNYFDPGMVDVSYPARQSYQSGNFSRGAWLIDTPADIFYASAWFNFIKGGEKSRGKYDMFSIRDMFSLRLEKNAGRDKLILSSACGGQRFSQVDFRYEPGWHFVSVELLGDTTVIRYDDMYWQVKTPERADCDDTSASLGPKLDAPWDGVQAENAVIRFYDFKVTYAPYSKRDLYIKRNHLMELGTDAPIVCNTLNGFERRDGLKACYPGPVVRIQYVYDDQPEPVVAPVEAVTADKPATVEDEEESPPLHQDADFAFGQREYLIMSGLVLLSSSLLASVFCWLINRKLKRKLAELEKEAGDSVRRLQELNPTHSRGSPMQARASGGLNV